MSKARLVITAVLVEARGQSEVARSYGVSQSLVSRLVARFRAEGEAAFEPRSRRHPKTSPNVTAPDVVDLVLRLRKELTGQGLDAGAKACAEGLIPAVSMSLDLSSVAVVAPILRRGEGPGDPVPSRGG